MPDNKNENPENDRRQNDLKLARFRGWSLTALYFALALWAIIFCYVTYSFWTFLLEQSDGSLVTPLVLLVSSVMTFFVSARAGHKFLKAMQSKVLPPTVDLLPFLAIAVTIVVAGQAFGTA